MLAEAAWLLVRDAGVTAPLVAGRGAVLVDGFDFGIRGLAARVSTHI